MTRRITISLLVLLLIAGLYTLVYAHHSYLLYVQQLRAVLNK